MTVRRMCRWRTHVGHHTRNRCLESPSLAIAVFVGFYGVMHCTFATEKSAREITEGRDFGSDKMSQLKHESHFRQDSKVIDLKPSMLRRNILV
jgi:hypothetical protein